MDPFNPTPIINDYYGNEEEQSEKSDEARQSAKPVERKIGEPVDGRMAG